MIFKIIKVVKDQENLNMINIYIVRHCKAEGQSPDAPLTDIGREQAHRLSDFLFPKKIESIISSPFARAYATVMPLADKLGMEIALDDRLAERVLTGEDHPDWLDMLRQTYDDLDLCYEGGESSRAAMDRAVNVLEEAIHSGYRNVVLVSHGNLISLLLKHFDERVGYKEWRAITNPDVFHLSYTKDAHNIERIWND